MTWYQAVSHPVVLAIEIAQLILIAVAVGVLLAVYRRVREAPRSQPTAGLPGPEVLTELDRALGDMHQELTAEHRRLRQLAEQLETKINRLQTPPPPAPVANDPLTAPTAPLHNQSARQEARRLLAEGVSLAEVAAATGLPAGELEVLANLQRAKASRDDS